MDNTADEPEGDAAQAFEALRAEVTALRRSVESLTAAVPSSRPPDYTPTLGQIAKGLENVHARLGLIEGHPALQLTPARHRQAMSQAGDELIGRAAEKFHRAAQVTESHGQQLAGLIGTVRDRDQQFQWLIRTGLAALVVGLLFSPVLASLLPFGLDGRIAASILRSDRWNAGAALMQAGNPEAWTDMEAADALLTPNKAALKSCREAAARTKKEQHCTIVVPAP